MDLGDRGGGDGDLAPVPSTQRRERGLALLRGEALGIVEQGGEVARDAGGEDHGGGDDRAGEWAAPHLVHARDPAAGGFSSAKSTIRAP